MFYIVLKLSSLLQKLLQNTSRFLSFLLAAMAPFQKAMWHRQFSPDIARSLTKGKRGPTLLPKSITWLT